MAVPGKTNNPNGRPKGSQNKDTKKLRESLQKIVEDHMDKFPDWLERVAEANPAEAIKLISAMSEYVLPKLSRKDVDLTSNGEQIEIPTIKFTDGTKDK
jgi:vacuolar-type H+-ATPase subunit E/Vma4